MNLIPLLSKFPLLKRSPSHLMDSAVSYFGIKEKKYLLSESDIPGLLKSLIHNHSLLQIDDSSILHYEDIYMDSKYYTFYYDLLDADAQKIKVRARTYFVTDTRYFQIKQTANDRKNIYSIQYNSPEEPLLTSQMIQLFNGLYTSLLHQEPTFIPIPLLRCTYKRAIFYNTTTKERCNIDFDLTYENMEGPLIKKSLQNIVIVEYKSPIDSKEETWLNTETASLKTVSKYGIGMHYCYDLPVSGSLKKTILSLEKLGKTKKSKKK